MSLQSSDTPPAEHSASPEVPDFEMIRPVGRGGFGEVWLATNRTTGQLCALKLIPLRHVGPSDVAAREIASLVRVEGCLPRQHPHLATIHHVGKTAEFLFCVMDPADDVRGGPATTDRHYQPATLQSRLEAGPLSAEACLEYAGQLLAGLASLHAAGMVHRDVKPANCLIVGGRLALADFGLVTEAHPLVSRAGTRSYMPPDGRMDMRADVYAAGLVIYEMVSGLPAAQFPRLGARTEAVRRTPALAALVRLALGACEPDPARRPADARAMLAELKRDRPTGRRRVLGRWLVGLAAAAIAVAGAWLAWSSGGGPATLGEVNFATEPFEAMIYLDGVLQRDAQGSPYTTPCTVPGIPAGPCRVEFQFPDSAQRWDAGVYDLGQTRQIVVRRPNP